MLLFKPEKQTAQEVICLLSSEIEIESYDIHSHSFLTDPPLAL